MAHLSEPPMRLVLLCVSIVIGSLSLILISTSNPVHGSGLASKNRAYLETIFNGESELVRKASYRWIVKREDIHAGQSPAVEVTAADTSSQPLPEAPDNPNRILASETAPTAPIESQQTEVAPAEQQPEVNNNSSSASEVDVTSKDEEFVTETSVEKTEPSNTVDAPQESPETAEPNTNNNLNSTNPTTEQSVQINEEKQVETNSIEVSKHEIPVSQPAQNITDTTPESNVAPQAVITGPLIREQLNSSSEVTETPPDYTTKEPAQVESTEKPADTETTTVIPVEVTPEADVAKQEEPQQVNTTTEAVEDEVSDNKVGTQIGERREPEVPSITVEEPSQVEEASQSVNNTSRLEEPDESNAGRNDSRPESSLFRLDRSTCDAFIRVVPEAILNVTIQRILNSLSNESCSDINTDIKLRPAQNRRVKNHLMEVGTMMVPVNKLIKVTDTVLVKCSCRSEGLSVENNTIVTDSCINKSTDNKVRFLLSMFDEMSDAQHLETYWRLYNRRSDEFRDKPVELGSKRGGRSKGRKMDIESSKCQRFRFESGVVRLTLHPFRYEMLFDVTMDPNASHKGGSIEMKNYYARGLYLDTILHKHTIRRASLDVQLDKQLAGSNSTGKSSEVESAKSIVHVMHDNNQHHRRNYWLLDMYNNWLRHEYRHQLKELFGPHKFARRFNICLS